MTKEQYEHRLSELGTMIGNLTAELVLLKAALTQHFPEVDVAWLLGKQNNRGDSPLYPPLHQQPWASEPRGLRGTYAADAAVPWEQLEMSWRNSDD